MNRSLRWMMAPLAAAALCITVSTAPVLAQGPGGGGGGGFQMDPAMRAEFDKFRKWRESHQNVMQVSQTMRAIGEMDKDPKTRLTKDQAKKVLAVVNAWKAKPTMSDDQAKTVNKQLTGALSVPQIKKMAALAAERRGRGGFGGGGGRGPGGPGGPGGAGFGGGGGRGPGGGGGGGGRGGAGGGGFRFNMKEYNPLNPGSMPEGRMRDRAKTMFTDVVKTLQTRAA